jgi:hypothetical protein
MIMPGELCGLIKDVGMCLRQCVEGQQGDISTSHAHRSFLRVVLGASSSQPLAAFFYQVVFCSLVCLCVFIYIAWPHQPRSSLRLFISSFHISIYAQLSPACLPPSLPPSLINKASPSAAATPPPPSSTLYSPPLTPGMSARVLALPLVCFLKPLIILNANRGGPLRVHPSDRLPCPSPCFPPVELPLCC